MVTVRIKQAFVVVAVAGMMNTVSAYPWQTCLANGGGSATFDIVVDYINDNVMYLVGDKGSGIFKSTDGGLNWRLINKGLTDLLIMAVDVSRTM